MHHFTGHHQKQNHWYSRLHLDVHLTNVPFVIFPNLERVSCYAMPMNLLKKTPEELDSMKKAGLDMLYLGIETGSDILLKKVTKGATAKTIIKSLLNNIRHYWTIFNNLKQY